MDKFQKNEAQKWCESNGWTDLFVQESVYYAFPPGAVIPLPVPVPVNHKRYFRSLNGLAIGAVLAVAWGINFALASGLWFWGRPVARSLIESLLSHTPKITPLFRVDAASSGLMYQAINKTINFTQGIIALLGGVWGAATWVENGASLNSFLLKILFTIVIAFTVISAMELFRIYLLGSDFSW